MMCAPAVDPVTMAAVVKQESGGVPWVVHNNSTGKSQSHPSKSAAVAAATVAIGRGESVDMGLAQINSKNLPALGLSVEQVFEPCTNIAAGASILTASYKKVGSLSGALGIYNTGKPDSTAATAYAQKVFAQAGVKVPAIPGGKLPVLPLFPQLADTPSSTTVSASLTPVRLVATPSPLAAGLAPVRMTLQPASWR